MKTLDQILSSSWVRTKIGEEIELPYGKGLPGRERIEGQYKVYGSNGVVGTHHDFLIEGPGIIVGRKGTVGAVNYCKENFWPIDTTYYVKTKKENRIRFWYYLLQMLELEDMNTHSAVPGLNRELVYQISIIIPEVSEQKTIEEIFGSLDDKIELNQRINQTLESLAHSLFHSWFVRFDPFLNDEFVESELGQLPKGWTTGRLESITEVVDCLHIKKPEKEDKGNYLLQVYNIGENGKLNLSNPFFVSDAIYNIWISRIEVKKGDIIISKTGRVGAVAQIPYIRAAIGRNLVCIRPNLDIINSEYLKELLLSRFMKNEIRIRTSSGTILQSLHVKDIKKLRVIVPPEKILRDFQDIIEPLHERIITLTDEINFLSSLRDLLLPQLLSGKQRIENPKLFLEEIKNEN